MKYPLHNWSIDSKKCFEEVHRVLKALVTKLVNPSVPDNYDVSLVDGYNLPIRVSNAPCTCKENDF